MTHKDKEERKAYNKKYYKEHVEERKVHNKKYYGERRRKALRLLGSRCFFCGKARNLGFHEKSGQRHSSKAVSLVLKNPEKFVLLCRGTHHVAVHFCMKWLHMGWKEISMKFLNKGGFK